VPHDGHFLTLGGRDLYALVRCSIISDFNLSTSLMRLNSIGLGVITDSGGWEKPCVATSCITSFDKDLKIARRAFTTSFFFPNSDFFTSQLIISVKGTSREYDSLALYPW